MRQHTGEKPYKCKFCENAFTTKGHLVEHERVHTGERPYVCGECGKAFKRSTTHRIHMRIHTKERPFQCPYCGKSFTESGNLKIHVMIHVFLLRNKNLDRLMKNPLDAHYMAASKSLGQREI